ncbi:hypothetical protein N7532_003211 [Penicillium argentinense]|uniref:F-box domain-containing protein n=1 Tax=Penicillium argentinense TaxID=1131581 RepID=A0A9W9FMH2_9EURO|nr:uncharacterized protein N7532_003211 [Penicillium argentinense]KAJ5102682.1 hypothetical protein N7532_003211 [Penicillium argentinense]
MASPPEDLMDLDDPMELHDPMNLDDITDLGDPMDLDPPFYPLSTLPLDCWILILKNLSRADLASVCRTSRALFASSTPTLYRHVKINWTYPSLRAILSLLTVIRERPYLAVCVRDFEALPSRSHPPSRYGPFIHPTVRHRGSLCEFPETVAFAKDIISTAQFPSPEDWTNALEAGDPHAFVTILITQLRNIRSLCLDYTFVCTDGWPGRMIKHALFSTDKLPRFPRLTYVEYGFNAPRPFAGVHSDNVAAMYPSGNQEQFSGWFYLSSLQSLNIWLQSTDGILPETEGFSTNPAVNTPRLKSLLLVHVPMNQAKVGQLLSFAKSVDEIHLGLILNVRDDSPNASLDPFDQSRDLLQGLVSLRNTLRHLSIELAISTYPGGPPLADAWQADLLGHFEGSLKQFDHLRSAEVPMVFLLGLDKGDAEMKAANLARLLPRNLRQLCLRDNSVTTKCHWSIPRMISAVQHMVPYVPHATPWLEQISLRSFCGLGGRFSRLHAYLATESCMSVNRGIKFEVRNDAWSPGLWTDFRSLIRWL